MEVSRAGALIDDVTPLRHAAAFPHAIATTGPDTPQPQRPRRRAASASASPPNAYNNYGNDSDAEEEHRIASSMSPSRRRRYRSATSGAVSRTRFYTIGAPSPRYKLPAVDAASPPFEFPIAAVVEPLQWEKFEAAERYYAEECGGERPANAPDSPARSIAVNTPINYFGNGTIRDMSPAERHASPRPEHDNAAKADDGANVNAYGDGQHPNGGEYDDDDASFEVRRRLDDDDDANDGGAYDYSPYKDGDEDEEGRHLASPSPPLSSLPPEGERSPANASAYPREEDSLALGEHNEEEASDNGNGGANNDAPFETIPHSEPADRPGSPPHSGGSAAAKHYVSGGSRAVSPSPIPRRLEPSASPIRIGEEKPQQQQQQPQHGFQSGGRMSVKASPLTTIGSVLEAYRDACAAFSASQTGASHCRSRLRSDADIDRLRLVLSAALSCSRALQALSQGLGRSHPHSLGPLFRLEEGKDVVTDATFERLVDLQAADVAVLRQALAAQEALLSGRQIAQDGLVDYQRATAALHSSSDNGSALVSLGGGGGGEGGGGEEANLETLAASLERRAEAIHAELRAVFPTASLSETRCVVLCAVVEAIRGDPSHAGHIAREAKSAAAQRFLESSGAAAAEPPQLDMPRLKQAIAAVAESHEALSRQRGVAASPDATTAPQSQRLQRGDVRSNNNNNNKKYFVQYPPRSALSAHFRNARRVTGDAPQSAASLEALRLYIKSLDQTRKAVLEPLEAVAPAAPPTATSSTSLQQQQQQRLPALSSSTHVSKGVSGEDGNSDDDDEDNDTANNNRTSAAVLESSTAPHLADISVGTSAKAESSARQQKRRAAVASVVAACESMGRRALPAVASAEGFASLVELLTPTVLWDMRRSPQQQQQQQNTQHPFSPQGLKEAFAADVGAAAQTYRRAFRAHCDAETVLIAFEDTTDAYVKACYDPSYATASPNEGRSLSPTAAGAGSGTAAAAGLHRHNSRSSLSAARAASTQQYEAELERQEAALRSFLASVGAANSAMRAQVERNGTYLAERKAVFRMLASQLRFLKRLDQVPLYFPPEFVVVSSADGADNNINSGEVDEATSAKLVLLRQVARVNSSMAQACLRSLANSLVTISKPDEDPSAKAAAEAENEGRIPRFLAALGAMQTAEEALSQALFACKRFLLRRDATAMAQSARGPAAASSSVVLGGSIAYSNTFDRSHAGLFGSSASPGEALSSSLGLPQAGASVDAGGAVFLFGPKGRPVPALQAELFRSNMRKLIDPGVLIYMRASSSSAASTSAADFVRYTISFHRGALDRLLLIPQQQTSTSNATTAARDTIPLPFAMVEMLTRGPKVRADDIGELQAMRLHFERRPLAALVKLGPDGRSSGEADPNAAAFYDSAEIWPPEGSDEASRRSGPLGAGTVASLVPLLAPRGAAVRRSMEVYFPSFASFQQWSDAFQMLIDNKALLGPHAGAYMLPDE